MARGSELETAAQQTRDHAARDGKRNCEGALRKGRRIARRHQATQSQRANGEVNAGAFVIGYPFSVIWEKQPARFNPVPVFISLDLRPLILSAFQQFAREGFLNADVRCSIITLWFPVSENFFTARPFSHF